MNQAESSTTSKLKEIQTQSGLAIPERLSFDRITSIPIPPGDELQSLSLEELIERVDECVVAESERLWSERNEIDKRRRKRFLLFSERARAEVLRWYLRGMDLPLAVRKVRSDWVAFHNRVAEEQRIKAEHKHTIEGFRHGDRIRYIGTKKQYREREGVVYKVQPECCLVKLDNEPPTPASGEKIFHFNYAEIENLTPRQPKKKKKPKLVQLPAISTSLRELADASIAEQLQRFFKTGKGEYGEGDKFLGIRVPTIRAQVKQFPDTSLEEIQQLLRSPFHEERLCALFLLVGRFERGDATEKTSIYQMYLNHTKSVYNWDLVDSSAAQIVGAYLEGKDKQPIYQLAKSDNLWERRMAIMATLPSIRNHNFEDTLAISLLLKHDRSDLIHKAVGWMLREVGKRDLSVEKAFLDEHYREMPRTMLRYAIEKFPEPERQKYLRGSV